MSVATPITKCACCGRGFRMHNLAVVVCPICIQVFVETGRAPGAPEPSSVAVVHYPTPRGVCASPACGKSFPPRLNQRYCSPPCRDAATTARALAREQAKLAAAKKTRGKPK